MVFNNLFCDSVRSQNRDYFVDLIIRRNRISLRRNARRRRSVSTFVSTFRFSFAAPFDSTSPAVFSPLHHLVRETPRESFPREVLDRIERENWREPSVMTDLMQLGVLWWFGDEKKRDFVMNVRKEEVCEE